jgi:hypothetical protein
MARPKKADATVEPRSGSIIRNILIGLLVAFCALGVVMFTMVRWTEKQVLNTDNWVTFISPIPKDPAVTQALSSFIVAKVFDPAAVEQRVADALPPRAGFLAGPMTEQLEQLTRRTTERLVGSDAFQSIWIAANRAAHSRMIDRARGIEPEGITIGNEKFNVDLTSVRVALQERLGRSASALEPSEQRIEIAADLQARRERLSAYVRTVDYLQATLPFIIIACLLGAMALARDRRKALMVVGILVTVLSLLQLIGVKALRPVVLDKLQDQSNRPAVENIYNTLLSSFNSQVYIAFYLGILVTLICILAGPNPLGMAIRRFIRVDSIRKSNIYGGWRNFRAWIAANKFYIWAATSFLALIYLAFVVEINWRTATNTLLVAVILVAFVQLLSLRPAQD